MCCTIKQDPSNSLNTVIYRTHLQDVEWQARWFVYWRPPKLRSFGSLSLLNDSYRVTNIGPSSINDLGFLKLRMIGSNVLTEHTWRFDLCWTTCDPWTCPSQMALPVLGWVIRRLGRMLGDCALYWWALTEPASHSDSSIYTELI